MNIKFENKIFLCFNALINIIFLLNNFDQQYLSYLIILIKNIFLFNSSDKQYLSAPEFPVLSKDADYVELGLDPSPSN